MAKKPFLTLTDVWPENGLTKVFLAQEDSKTGAIEWLLKGFAGSDEGQALSDRLGETRVTGVVRAGSTMMYIYIDKKMAEQVRTFQGDCGEQLSLLSA